MPDRYAHQVPYPPPYYRPQQSSYFGTWSAITACCGFALLLVPVLPILIALLSIVLGIAELSVKDKVPSRGMAVVGFTVSVVVIVLAVLYLRAVFGD